MSGQKTVGVIFSRPDLQRALRLRKSPDLFELRLDRLITSFDELKDAAGRLSAPLIVTARDPREGGANNLSAIRRRELLLEFLLHAHYVDVELHSARVLRPVLRAAAEKKIETIISFHDLRATPRHSELDKIVQRARSLGASIVKVATRTDTRPQLDTLLDFFERQSATGDLAAMGIGRLGRIARLELARRGSALNYGHLGAPAAAGQLSIQELRKFAEAASAVS
jgi:3-dehydroquinate dehydratase type I